MPEHTSFISYLIALFPALGENMKRLGHTMMGHRVEEHHAEPLVTSLVVVVLIVGLALAARGAIKDYDKSVVPDAKLSLRTFWELFIGYFYDMMKDMMGAKRAKRYFPIVGTCACFIFFANFIGFLPGFQPPTSSLSITFGCALVVLGAFTYYGFKEGGFGFIKHLFGPWMGPLFIPINILVFLIEFLSTFIIRPITLSVRLMLNIAVDHLLVTIMLGILAVGLPLPFMLLGTLVCAVQVLVFCLLTSIYITLATEHDDHGHADHGHAPAAHGAAPAHP